MRKLLFILLLLTLPAAAQTKINLGTQAQGQLPAANAQPVVNALPSVTGSGGARRGVYAANGFAETFVPDGHCTNGAANGWDKTTNLDCSLPGFYHAPSGTFDLERTLAYGVTNNQPPSPQHFALTVSGRWANDTIGSIGVSTCAVGTYGCGSANELVLTWNGSGLFLIEGGTSVTLWSVNGNGPGTAGLTDSGPGQGWAPPVMGALYAFSLAQPGDGTVIISATQAGVAVGTLDSNNSGSFVVRFPGGAPSGNIHSIFARGGTADYMSDFTYSGGFTLQGASSTVYDVVNDHRSHAARALRWAMHSDGTECSYTSLASSNPDTTCSNVYAYLPPNYDPNASNPWYLNIRGEENSTVRFFGGMGSTHPVLFGSGMVAVYGDWHGYTWYGASRDLADIAAAQGIVRNSLALADRPVVIADSGGGVNAANAITHGVLRPKALVCISCNLNLLADAQGNDYHDQTSGSNQMSFIAADYGFSSASQYAQYTAGYDPMLVVQNPLTPQGALTGGTYNLLPNAAQVLAAVPTLLIADQGCNDDQIVNPCVNSTAYYNAISALNPGVHSLQYVSGGHVSLNKFNGIDFLTFLNAH